MLVTHRAQRAPELPTECASGCMGHGGLVDYSMAHELGTEEGQNSRPQNNYGVAAKLIL